MTSKNNEPINETTTLADKKGVLLELEYTATNGREIFYQVLEKIMKAKDMKLSDINFMRYCINPPINKNLPELVLKSGKKRVQEEKLLDELAEKLESAFLSKKITANEYTKAIIEKALLENSSIGLITMLKEESGEKMAYQLGIESDKLSILSYANEKKEMPTADAWLKLAKKMEVAPSRCLVISTSKKSNKAALSAGMKSVILTDKFTSFQDFAGADYVFDELDKDAITKIMDLLKTC